MNLQKRKPRTVHRGNMLLQLGIVMAIVLLIAPGAIDRYAGQQQEKVWTGTASHLSFVAQAGKRYVRDNRDKLLNQVSGGPIVITGATLRSQGYLPAGFSLTNDSGQTYQLAVARDPGQAGQLVAFVLTTGGSEIPYKGLRQIATDTEGMGGYIWPANMAVGADGGWQARLSDYGLSGQQGRLAAFLSADALGTDADESDRLYRYQVNGRPDLNRMHTAIDMNGNNINNGGTVNANTGSFNGQVSAGSNVTAGGSVTANGNVIANGDINAGNNVNANNGINANNDIRSNNGWIITRGDKGWLNESHGGGFYMSDNDWVRSVNNKNIYTGGQMRAGSLRSDGDISASGVLSQDQVNTVGASCGQLGAISHDATGALLACQSGIWQSSVTSKNIVSVSTITKRFSAATATCPAPKKVVGGGGNCESITNQGTVWLVTSIPSGDASWFAYCDSTKEQMIRSTSYAICE